MGGSFPGFCRASIAVIRRFQIEELIVQDASGVVFRAQDSETGSMVAVRRFFPFGPDGGGLDEDEQTAYKIAVERLATITHPSLRAVISGGCDPVDGMPFITTEWVEGASFSEIRGDGPVDVEVVKELVDQALEVSEVLSHVLAEEAVWVETALESIVVGSERSGRRFTFWMDPLKWLGKGGESRGLESLVEMVEELMDWKGRVVNDHAGRGLGGWVRWMKSAAETTSLREAREMLAASVGDEPPVPAQQVVAMATGQPELKSMASGGSKSGVFAVIGLGLVVIGVAGWVMFRGPVVMPYEQPGTDAVGVEWPGEDEPADGIGGELPMTGVEQANQRARELADELKAEREELEKQRAEAEEKSGVIGWEKHALLATKRNQMVTVEGRLEKIGFSRKRKTMYLLFSETPGRNDTRGAVVLSRAENRNTIVKSVGALVGKKIRIKGKVLLQTGHGMKRPDIQFTSRSAIEVVEEAAGN